MEGMERDCPLRRYEPLWGTWYVDGLLGRGSFGSVWQLRRETEGGTEYAALKEVLIAPSGGRMEGLDAAGEAVYFRAVLEETLAEAERMAGLAPCGAVVEFQACQAVELDGPGERGWRVLIRMERLVPVRELLETGGFPLREAARLAADIARALEACQEQGIVHRDIKPDNLFYAPASGRYKLGDFGLARHLARPTEGKGRAGTLSHMSPEVYQGAPFTPACDQYALGMVLYRLLNDNRIPLLPPYPEPFTPDQRDRALVRRLRGEEIGPPSVVRYAAAPGEPETGLGAVFEAGERELAAALGRIAQRAVAARPRERYPSARAFREAVEQALAGGPEQKENKK